MRYFKEVENDYITINKKTILPNRSDNRSAGYDFYSKENKNLMPGETHLFYTDIKAYMLEDEVLNIYIRSSLGIKHDLCLLNQVGIIDSSYYENKNNDGNIIIAIKNCGKNPYQIIEGNRIAQGVFTKYLITNNDNSINNERIGGIGSSGI